MVMYHMSTALLLGIPFGTENNSQQPFCFGYVCSLVYIGYVNNKVMSNKDLIQQEQWNNETAKTT